MLADLNDQQRLRHYISGAGTWAPLVTVLLIAAAIIFSPVPSAPIAVVAGVLFGVSVGTALVTAGSLLGASVAFWISHWLGYPVLRRWASAREILQKLERQRSQNALMAAVFVSRLIPLISFDAVSYAAGLTPLAFWRFALATALGVLPISFLLVKLGEQAGSAPSLLPLVLLVGMITLVPLLVAIFKRRKTGSR